MQNYTVTSRDEFLVGGFRAMASPCEIIVNTRSQAVMQQAASAACTEALRIEKTFSRYRDDNIIYAINNSGGQRIKVDEETANLLDFANQCYDLSDGLFDITSGVLRRAWNFTSNEPPPDKSSVDALLPLVGWDLVRWQRPYITLPDNMQIDFGGIGKEYAVDRTVGLVKTLTDAPFLVNFGGDLHASAPPTSGKPWAVGIEHHSQDGMAVNTIKLLRGAVTTSGDSHRYIEYNGTRYGHVLHPKTGWPVPDAPHSVSVLSNSCTEAGVLSTLAMLQGAGAEQFLEDQGVRFWCQR